VVKGLPASLRILVIIKSESFLFGVLEVVNSFTLRERMFPMFISIFYRSTYKSKTCTLILKEYIEKMILYACAMAYGLFRFYARVCVE
jgi:hypothetical protein